jgi:hypothetical protein
MHSSETEKNKEVKMMDSESSNELAHHGVKGMKWGVRKKRVPYHKDYNRNERARDERNSTGIGTVRRINKRMHKGQDLATARKNEAKFKKRRKVVITAAVLAAKYGNPQARENFKMVFGLAGSIAGAAIRQRAETKRGESFIRNSFAESNGLRGVPKVTKQKRGTYNISSL